MKAIFGRLLTSRFFYNPIFIVGASRSGTSVLLQSLGKHPLILSTSGEAPFLTSMGGAAYLFEYSPDADYYSQSLRMSKKYLYDVLRRLSFEIAAGEHYGLKMIIKSRLRRELSFLRKKYWCAKTFPVYDVARGLLKLFPNAKFIYIVRNGIEVVHSMSKYSGFRSREFETNCQAWVKSVANFDYLNTFDNALVIRHENLVSTPNELFTKIFNFIGIHYDSAPTQFATTTLIHPLDKPTQSNIIVQNRLIHRKALYETWSPGQREKFKNICTNAMNNLGYHISF